MTLQDAIDLVQNAVPTVRSEYSFKALCVVVAVLQEREQERERVQEEKEAQE